MADHTLTLTRGALNLLNSSLLQPDWAKDTAVLYRAGSMIERIDGQYGDDKMPKPPESEKPDQDLREDQIAAYNEQVTAWADREVTFEISEKEREACKTCITEAVKQGRISPTRHYLALARTLGLTGE